MLMYVGKILDCATASSLIKILSKNASSKFNKHPPAYSSLRHRFAGRRLQGGEDGRDGWGGRGPGGARPPRWRGRAHARAAAADVGATQAGDGAAAPTGRGPGAGLARARRDRGRAERLARPVPGRGRGVAEEPPG